MRADIHDGPEHMLQSEAGYIDARPLTPARQNLLQRTAGPYIRVKSAVLTIGRLLPVYPQLRTSPTAPAMSVSCQHQTSVDHLVRTAEQRWWNDDTKCFGRLNVDSENEFSRLFHRYFRYFGAS